jgi:hypothetical protein
MVREGLTTEGESATPTFAEGCGERVRVVEVTAVAEGCPRIKGIGSYRVLGVLHMLLTRPRGQQLPGSSRADPNPRFRASALSYPFWRQSHQSPLCLSCWISSA